MNYRQYLWKCTRETLEAVLFYLTVIGMIALMLGVAALLIFLGIKYVEFLSNVFGLVISFFILIGTFGFGLCIIFLFFNYRHYKNYVKDGVKE